MREFFAPAPLLAVALMGLNDAYLKYRFHNALTGKLSDLAGCFFLPLFVSALLALVTPLRLATRLGIGATVTVVLFGAIKLSQPVGDNVCLAMDWVGRRVGTGCGRIIADRSDLLALPCVLLALLQGYWSHRPVATQDLVAERQGGTT
jgi:hypothetical protein